MTELKAELFAMPMHAWRFVPITVSHHKWWLKMYKLGEDGNYWFCFESPTRRRYSFRVRREREDGRVRVTDADVTTARGETIACCWEGWCYKPDRLDAVIRLTPKHILDRLFVLLDAIG